MKTTKQISVLIPSRKRIDSLIRCVNNLVSTADDPNNFEVLIRLDHDDKDSIKRIEELPYDKVDIYIIIGNRFGGYADLHLYVNELCAISNGRFLFLYNDDATILTKKWDLIIVGESQVVGLNPLSNTEKKQKYDIFPIIHRKIYETLGFFSLSPHNDSWMFELIKTVELEKKIPELKIRHYRIEARDVTYDEKVSQLKISQGKHRKEVLGAGMIEAKRKIEEAKKHW